MHLAVERSGEIVNRSPKHKARHPRLVKVAVFVEHVLVHHDILAKNGARLDVAHDFGRPVHDGGKPVEFPRIRNNIAIVGIPFRNLHLEPFGIEHLVAFICRSNGIDRIPAEVLGRIPAGKDISLARDGPRELRPDSMGIRIYAKRINPPAIGFKRYVVCALVIAPVLHVGSLCRRDMRYWSERKILAAVPGHKLVVFALDLGNPEFVTGKDFPCAGFATARIESNRYRGQRHLAADNAAKNRIRIGTYILAPRRTINAIVVIIAHQGDYDTVGKFFLRHGCTDRIYCRSKGKYVVYKTPVNVVFSSTSRHRARMLGHSSKSAHLT